MGAPPMLDVRPAQMTMRKTTAARKRHEPANLPNTNDRIV
jgi:hypothetical protein